MLQETMCMGHTWKADGSHFIFGSFLRELALSVGHLFKIWNVGSSFLDPYLNHVALSMRHIYEIQVVWFRPQGPELRHVALSLGHLFGGSEFSFLVFT